MGRIGVIGLGRMGSAIAQRMTTKGQTVLGWTRSGRTVKGVKSAADLESIVAESDTLILSLIDDTAVDEVLDALLALDLKGKQIIETSTVVPSLLTSRIEQILANGATAVDAPISGGPEMVLAGSYGIFVGGEDAWAAKARDSLAAISQRIVHVGPLGTGLVMKVINNSMIQVYMSGLAELMPLASQAGLPLDSALRILCGGPAGLPMVTARIPKIFGEDKSVGFPNSAVFKDNDVFQRVLKSYGLTSQSLFNFGLQKDAVVKAGLLEHDAAELVRYANYGGENP